MAPELFSEEIKPRQFQPAPRKMVFPFRRTRNPAKEDSRNSRLSSKDKSCLALNSPSNTSHICIPGTDVPTPLS